MGIDINRIAKIETLPREHFCPVCQLLIDPNEALQSMCGHLYCRPCLAYVASTTRACLYDGYLVKETDSKPLVESNRVLADTIGKTLVHCSYERGGCRWVGSLADSWFHCSGCAFGDALVTCSWCGTKVADRHWEEHVQVCLDANTEASFAMATSQASVQGHGIASATLTQEQWYQQPYQQYYRTYVGDYMQQQPMQPQCFAPQNQVVYVQVRPTVHCVAQSQSLGMNQPRVALPSPPQLRTAQDHTGQSNQVHAYWTGQNNPQPNQTNNMFVYHHDHFPEQLSHALPPQSLYTRQTVLNYGRAPVPESSYMHSSGTDAVPYQMHQEGPSYHPHIPLHEHQPMTPILGLQPTMNYFSPTAPHVVGLGHGAPSLSEEDDMERIQNQVHWASSGQDDEEIMEGLEARSPSESTNVAYNVNRFMPHENHEPDFELRSSQPSMDLGQGQLRRTPRSPISEHFGMPSHGYRPLDHGLGGRRAETTDMIGAVDSNNGLRLGDVGSHQSRYTLQGYPGDGVSFPGDLGFFSSSGNMATNPIGSSDFHMEQQEMFMDMASMTRQNAKRLNASARAPASSSRFGNQDKNEEGRFKGPG